MFDELTDGMLRQLTLIEIALDRKLTDEDDPKEIGEGFFYLNPEEIVRLDGSDAYKVSYFLLPQHLQHAIWDNYGSEL